jgi:predicted metal-binding membrane protein
MIGPLETGGQPSPTVIGRDRMMIVVALVALSAISWLYLVDLAASMGGATGGEMGQAMGASISAWSASQFGLMFVMWWVMMVGMMVPSAAPMILMFATINRRRRARDEPFVPTAVFGVGYLLSWGAFSLVATSAQWGLEEAALLSPMMVSTSPVLGGVLFIAAGIYQWTPLKYACLKNCRSPLGFIMTHWRDGPLGSLRMGVEHGVFCLGCCWSIMALLFVGGVMNLLWVAAIAAFVFVEKLFPAGEMVARGAGVLMVAAGGYLLVAG